MCDNDSDRFILINQSSKYKASSKSARKVLPVLATFIAVERIFSQSGLIFRLLKAKMSRKTLKILTLLKCNQRLM